MSSHITVISLGAGVQSTTLALMAAKGEIGPMPDCAIFADTGWEPKAVYEHLSRLEAVLPFPVHRVSGGDLRAGIMAGRNSTGQPMASGTVPWFTGDGGMGGRQCTRHYKIDPLRRKQRELLGAKPRSRIAPGSVEVWIGISLDEAIRMKPSFERWRTNRWPLLELRMTRRQCVAWLSTKGWSAPKSACIGCPYHSDDQWRALRNDPEAWADAVEVDNSIRGSGRKTQFMHRSLKPLAEVDLSTPSERGQLDLFLNECEGMCGV